MDVAFDNAAVDLLEARFAGDDDVLAELSDQLLTLVLERVDGARAVGVHLVEHLLRERLELVVLRDRLRLAAHGDHRAVAVRAAVADESFGRLAACALRGGGHAALAQEDPRGLDVAARLLERALAVHHPCARLVAKLLDEACGNRGNGHDLPSCIAGSAAGRSVSIAGSASGSDCAAAAGCSGVGSGSAAAVGCSASGSGAAAGAAGSGAGAGSGSGSGSAAAAISCGVTRCLPASMPSAITRVIRLQARIASSLPGIA